VNRPLSPTDLKRLHRQWRHRPMGRLALMLEDVQGPFNVGTMVRTAAAERLEHLWLVGATPAPTQTKVQRTAMGCERLIPWHQVETVEEAVVAARAEGYRIVGIELTDTARPVFELDMTVPTCVVVGHEDRGLSSRFLGLCDDVAFVPQLGRVGSLNVAQAAAMAMYEARRQVWTGSLPTP
jgi:tRNA (guanosine-2'-O-)-methyltransferase